MYPLNDKDLDRLSRDAAEHYDVESSASGWERLEKRLDKEMPVKEKDRRRFLFWLFLIALLSGGSLIYMLGRTPSAENELAATKEESSKTAASSSTNKTGNADKKANDNTVALDQQKTKQADKTAPVTVAGEKEQPATSPVVKTDAAAKTIDNKTNVQKNISPEKNTIVTRNKPVVVSNRKDRSPKPVRNKSQKLPASSYDQQNDILLAQKDNNAVDKKAAYLLTATMPVIDKEELDKKGIAADIKEEKQPPVVTAELKQKSPTVSVKPSKWEFGILTGPDFSNVGFKDSYKTGFNLGLTVGYRISNRLQVNTGLVYTKKYYKVAGEDFYPPKHSWIAYQDVVDVKGSCSMFEIPLNLRYDFSYNKKSRWFASTGLSSYIMDKQDYDCRYYYNGELKNYPWATDSNYNYVMSNLNFSIGYERAIGKNISIQAEPYIKLPLRGLGYGNIDMNSYGLYVTFKYKPSVRLPKKK